MEHSGDNIFDCPACHTGLEKFWNFIWRMIVLIAAVKILIS